MKFKTLAALVVSSTLCLAGCSKSGQEPEPQAAPTVPSQPDITEPPSKPKPPKPQPTEPPKPEAPAKPASVSFFGDVHFEGGLAGLLTSPERSLRPLRSHLAAADFTYGNLEAALATGGSPDPKELESPSNRYHFRTDGRALEGLASAGVDLLTVANNHGADFGIEGMRETLAFQKSSPVPIVGVGQNREAAFRAHRVTVKGQNFAFFAADASKLESNGPTWQAGRSPGLAFARGEGLKYLLKQVREAKARGEAPVVYLHWGPEGERCPDGNQVGLAQALANAGASAVVGSHTHQVMGAGWLGDTYVAYGLGNFLWYHGGIPETGLLTLKFQDGRVTKDAWAPGLIPSSGGLPTFIGGAEKSSALKERNEDCSTL